jgi:hypothetical protein
VRELSVGPRFLEICVHPFKYQLLAFLAAFIFRVNHILEMSEEGARCYHWDSVGIKFALKNEIFDYNSIFSWLVNPRPFCVFDSGDPIGLERNFGAWWCVEAVELLD